SLIVSFFLPQCTLFCNEVFEYRYFHLHRYFYYHFINYSWYTPSYSSKEDVTIEHKRTNFQSNFVIVLLLYYMKRTI
ncbi:TPA_asm: oncoid, partial [Physarum slime mold MELD virus]